MAAFLQPLVGLFVLVFVAWAASEARRKFPWRWALGAISVQLVLAFLFLRVGILQTALGQLGQAVRALEEASRAGSAYMFGYLGGAPLPFETKADANTLIIAFQILPIILVTAALAAILWHWRILPALIHALSWALSRTLGIGGAAGLGTAANFFLGVVESPLVVRAYIARMSRSELFMVMTAGLSTVSGAVLVLYASVIDDVVSNATGHILTASLISLPAALLFARIMIPGDARTGAENFGDALRYDNTLDALVKGVEDGLRVFLSVLAMLIVVFALVYLCNLLLALLPDVAGEPLSVNRIFGWVFAPLVVTLGIPVQEAGVAGQLMGTKAILNEFIAYQELATLEEGALSARSAVIMTYALCGFANLASIGLQLATFSTLAPERRAEIASMGWRAWFAGNLASAATACVAAITLPVSTL
ncbi:MAG: nucleoside transporter C-terminal domain-containing protein [Pseudomonadota bacterium]